MGMQNHYYVLTISFYVRCHSTQFQERLEGTLILDFPHTLLCQSIYASFIGVLLFSFHYETTTKAKFIFYAKENGSSTSKTWRSAEEGWPWSGRSQFIDVSCSKFQYHSLTQTILEMTQFKMPCGTYDPLWLISRLNIAGTRAILV